MKGIKMEKELNGMSDELKAKFKKTREGLAHLEATIDRINESKAKMNLIKNIKAAKRELAIVETKTMAAKEAMDKSSSAYQAAYSEYINGADIDIDAMRIDNHLLISAYYELKKEATRIKSKISIMEIELM